MASSSNTVNIHIKTLKGAKMALEINLDHSVAELKQQIETELKLGEAATMRLVYCGKILKKDQKLSSFGFKDGEFIVLTKVKKRVAPRPPSRQPAAAPPVAEEPSQPPPSEQPSTQPEQPAATGATSANTEIEGTLANLMAMGFTREQCQQALMAAYNNAERAVEYLLNGLPANFNPEEVMPTGNRNPAASSQQRRVRGPPGGAPGGQGTMQQLMASPENLQRALILRLIQSPRVREIFFQVVQTVQPDFQLSTESNEAMQNIMGLLQDVRILQMVLHELIGAGAGGPPRGGQQVHVTAEEFAQVKNLASTLGVSQQRAIEAFILAERNIELAASFLVNEGGLGGLAAAPDQPEPTSAQNTEMQVEAPEAENAPESMQIEENQNEEESGDNSGQNDNDPKAEN